MICHFCLDNLFDTLDLRLHNIYYFSIDMAAYAIVPSQDVRCHTMVLLFHDECTREDSWIIYSALKVLGQIKFDAREWVSKQSLHHECVSELPLFFGGGEMGQLYPRASDQVHITVARYSISLVSGFCVRSRNNPVGVCVHFPVEVISVAELFCEDPQ